MMQLSVDGEPLGNIKPLIIAPDDVIVVECDRPLSARNMHELTERLRAIFAGHKVVIAGEGFTLDAVSPDQAPEGGSDGE